MFDCNYLDLLLKIFKPEKHRINIKQVLHHPYLKNAPKTIYKNNNNIVKKNTNLTNAQITQSVTSCIDISHIGCEITVTNDNNSNNQQSITIE